MPDPVLRITINVPKPVMEAKGPRIVQVLATKLTALMIQLQSYIIGQKLSGQMLHRRIGVLAGSIRAIPAIFEGTTIRGAVEGAGGPAFYGKFFELESAGGTGGTKAHAIVAVKARALRFVMGGQIYFRKSVQHPGFAARPFMSTSLTENAADIEAQLNAAVSQVIQEP